MLPSKDRVKLPASFNAGVKDGKEREMLLSKVKEEMPGLAKKILEVAGTNDRSIMTPAGTRDGIRVAKQWDGPIVRIRGVGTLPVPLQDVRDMICITDTDPFRRIMSAVDAMFIDGSVVERLQGRGTVFDSAGRVLTRSELPYACVKWASFAAPAPLVWSRDFIYVEYTSMIGDALCIVTNSVELTPCPELQSSHKFIRGITMLSGYVIKPINDSTCEMAYIVQVDAKGLIPVFVQNMIAPMQADNVKRWRVMFETRLAAAKLLNMPSHPPVGSPVPNMAPVPRRSSCDVTIQIATPNTVVEFTFVPAAKDIGAALVGEGLEGADEWMKNRLFKSGTPHGGKVTASKAGAIVLRFHNGHSMFTSKTVAFQVTLTPPATPKETGDAATATGEGGGVGAGAGAGAGGGAGGGAGAGASSAAAAPASSGDTAADVVATDAAPKAQEPAPAVEPKSVAEPAPAPAPASTPEPASASSDSAAEPEASLDHVSLQV